jgi:transposase InsO family protein
MLRGCRTATAVEVTPGRGRPPVRSAAGHRVAQGCPRKSRELDLRTYVNGVTLDFSRPGKPPGDAHAEALNARVGAGCLGSGLVPELG